MPPSTFIGQLLEDFVLGALGLTLEARIEEMRSLPVSHQNGLSPSQTDLRAWVAWHTNKGAVTLCGTYDQLRSQTMRAHVLLIEWWVAPNEHHVGWWHCYPKRTREWIKGPGTPFVE
jgi:hypothetical protein